MGNILIIEDDEAMRNFIFSLASDMGHKVTAPTAYYDGSCILKSEKFDLVIYSEI